MAKVNSDHSTDMIITVVMWSLYIYI